MKKEKVVSTMASDRVMADLVMASRRSSYSFKYINRPPRDIHAIMVAGSMVNRNRMVTVNSETIPNVIWNMDITAITIRDSRDSSSVALRSSAVLL